MDLSLFKGCRDDPKEELFTMMSWLLILLFKMTADIVSQIYMYIHVHRQQIYMYVFKEFTIASIKRFLFIRKMSC